MNLQVLADHGVSTEAWRKIFEKADIPKSTAGLKSDSKDFKLARSVNRIRSRIEDGQRHNFKNYRVIHAMDKVWDTPFRQSTKTMVEDLLKGGELFNEIEMSKILKAKGYDLDSVVRETGRLDPKTGKPEKTVVVPAFYEVTVPLVRSYLTVRKAKLVNDRNRDPFLHYKPIINTPKNRTKTHVLTNRAQLMNTQYNYITALDQATFQMLLYPTGAIMFTLEDWHVEVQKRYKSTTAEEAVSTEEKPKKKKKGKKKKPDGDKLNPDHYEDYIVREGLRQYVGHPSRSYIDRAFSPRTLNTDTGCRYVGFWKVVTYGEILDTEEFYNTAKINRTSDSFFSNNTDFFNSVYNTCALNYGAVSSTAAPSDREETQLNSYYGQAESDRSVVLVEHREKLIPKDFGLGDYEHPIWARFVMAGDGTVVFAQPMGYVPATVWKDNGDDKRTEDASLALNLVGFQDHFENLLSQHILTVKQNLANITLIDQNIFDRDKRSGILETLKNLGEQYYRKLNIFPVDGKQIKVSQNSVSQAFYSHKFPPMDTAGIIGSLKLILDLAERVLQFSNQEVAQQATHEQTREEIKGIAGSTTNVLEYTGLPVDQGMAAMGKQIHDAWNNYGEDDFATSIPSDTPLTKPELEEMGFILQQDIRMPNDPFPVKVDKSVMELPLFAVIPATRDRVSDAEAARVMAEFVRDLSNNPMMAQALGSNQMIDLANQIAKLAGLPLNRELRDLTQVQQQGILQQVLEKVLPMVKEGMIPVLKQLNDDERKIGALFQMLGVQAPQEANAPNNNNPDAAGQGAGNPGMAQLTGGAPLPQAPVGATGPVAG